MSFYVRVWQPCDVEGIAKHLLTVGDVTADCANCRELGIDYVNAKHCPKCGTAFKFIAARNVSRAGGTVRRIKERRPDLTMIDYDDYKSITGKQQAKDFFGE